MGVTAEEDESGNLLARIPGRNERSLLLCAHLDTVETEAPIEPVLVDGQWENAHEGILGADNKAAVAVMLETARRATVEGRLGIELLFTVSEEDGLVAKAFDVSRLRSEFGYVFDHATPIGDVVVAAPTYFRLERRSTARPRTPASAPRTGAAPSSPPRSRSRRCRSGGSTPRPPPTSARCAAGSAPPTSSRSCRVLAEARSLDPSRVEDVVAGIVEPCTTAPRRPSATSTSCARSSFTGFKVRPSAPELVAAEAALRTCGYEPRRIQTGGGSDANALQAAGFPCLNLANGTEQPRADRARVGRRARGDARRLARAARGGRRRLMLMLRRGVVLAAGDPGGPMQDWRSGSAASGGRRWRTWRWSAPPGWATR